MMNIGTKFYDDDDDLESNAFFIYFYSRSQFKKILAIDKTAQLLF